VRRSLIDIITEKAIASFGKSITETTCSEWPSHWVATAEKWREELLAEGLNAYRRSYRKTDQHSEQKEELKMITIGGKTKKPHAPMKPQVVIQIADGINQFALLSADDKGHPTIDWIGDPNAATKFDSKYSAKFRTMSIADIPETRVFSILEIKK